MQLAAPVQSAGFPQSYPYAQSMPLPSAILRPLQQPLYDTEYLQVTAAVATANEQIFFQRQLGQTTAFGAAVKTESETNLQQPGQLANPIEFSLFGFYFEVAPDTSVGDFVSYYRQASFTYTYTGNRIYLQIPLTRIPQGVGPEGFSGTAGIVATIAGNNGVVHNGVGHISNMYKFTIGRSALRIRPTESFQAKVRWPSGFPTFGLGAAPATAGSVGGTGVVLGMQAYVGTTGAGLIRTRTILGGLTWTAL